jgi:hypothetical protein
VETYPLNERRKIMNKKLFSIVLLVVFSCSAHAADSKVNRGDSTVLVGLSTGVHLATLLTTPFKVGVYLGERIEIGAEYGSASAEQKDGDDKAKATYTNAGLYGRIFLGNSFNILAAVHQRNWTAEATVTELNQTASADLTANAMVATLGIGNQWLTDIGFTIGCDWLIGSTAISSSQSVSLTSSTYVDTQEAETELEELGEVLNSASAMPGVLVLTLGWSF